MPNITVKIAAWALVGYAKDDNLNNSDPTLNLTGIGTNVGGHPAAVTAAIYRCICDDRGLGARPFAVFGAISIGFDVELANRVDAEKVAAHSARSNGKLARSGVFDAVKQHGVIHRTAAIDGESNAVAGTSVGAFQGVVNDARGCGR